MVVNFDFCTTIPTCGSNEEYVTLVPIGVIYLTESILAGVKQIFGVHNVIEERIDFDVGGQIYNFYLHQL